MTNNDVLASLNKDYNALTIKIKVLVDAALLILCGGIGSLCMDFIFHSTPPRLMFSFGFMAASLLLSVIACIELFRKKVLFTTLKKLENGESL